MTRDETLRRIHQGDSLAVGFTWMTVQQVFRDPAGALTGVEVGPLWGISYSAGTMPAIGVLDLDKIHWDTLLHFPQCAP